MKYRVKFSKNGPIKYIGHLDVMRYFQKAIRRAEIPIAYSEGFSPHQILSFAFPLSVGYTSEGEYFDMELTTEVNEADLIKQLNSQMADGIEVITIMKLSDKSSNCMASVFAATYRITFGEGNSFVAMNRDSISDFFGQSTIPVNKPKKKGGGFVDIDLAEFIYNYFVSDSFIEFTVNASSSDNIKPDFVVDCMKVFLNSADFPLDYDVKRIELWGNKGNENIDLVRLIDF